MEFLQNLPREFLPLALVLATLFLVVYTFSKLYPLFKKEDIASKGTECLVHSSVVDKVNDHNRWLDDSERRIIVLEKSVVVLEDHNKRTDQRIEKLEQTVSDLKDLVLPMSGKVENIEKQVSEIHKKIDLFMQKF